MGFLSDYDMRTAWKHERMYGCWMTDGRLLKKVSAEGRFLPFAGTTTLFRLDRRTRNILGLMQQNLYRHLGDTGMLADPLPLSSLHMTLHDLDSPETCMPDTEEGREREMRASLEKAGEAVEKIRRELAGKEIAMACDCMVNMVSVSLVLLLRPETEEDFALLQEMYRRLDNVRTMSYPLTPHVTLAYFRPGMLDGNVLSAALDAVRPREKIVFPLYPEALTPAWFSDMRRYADVPERICFVCDGGLNRSVMAAAIVNQEARRRGLSIRCEARAAFHASEGRTASAAAAEVLERHGISTEGISPCARCLEEREDNWFSRFAPVSAGAADRMNRIGAGHDRICLDFLGVRDPEYGEAAYEDVFRDLYSRAAGFLDRMERKRADM